MQRQPLEIPKNSDSILKFYFKNANGNIVKLYDQTIKATIHKDNQSIIVKYLQITNGKVGEAQLTIRKEDTMLLDIGYYHMMLTVDDGNTDSVAYVDGNTKSNFDLHVVGNPSSITFDITEIQDFPVIDQFSTIGVSRQIPGAGVYTHSTGLHTVSMAMTSYTGSVKIQASIQSLPQSTDWFDVEDATDTGIAGLPSLSVPIEFVDFTGTESYSFLGNYRWIRFVIDQKAGNVDKIITSV